MTFCAAQKAIFGETHKTGIYDLNPSMALTILGLTKLLSATGQNMGRWEMLNDGDLEEVQDDVDCRANDACC